MIKLFITVPKDSSIANFLVFQPAAYRITKVSSTSVSFSYGGTMLPSDKIKFLVDSFKPSVYTISKNTNGFLFVVRS